MGEVCNTNNLTITCIARSMEDYLSFSIRGRSDDGNSWQIRFIDSFQFMGASLETLAADMNDNDFHAMRHFYPQHWKLFTEKQSFPYEEMTGWDVFDRTYIPPQPNFTTKMKGPISDERYAHFCRVWQELGLRNWGDMHDVYVDTDTLSLHDIAERFRDICLRTYGLDPFHYITLPGFTLDACLKMTGAKLDLLTDIDMYTMLEGGCRGGVSVISKREESANNPYLDNFKPEDPTSYLIYYNNNNNDNLYGGALSDPLPIRNFRWLSDEDVAAVDWANHPEDDPTGYILEVDLDYPDELHDDHNDYPMAPDHLEISENIISPYSQRIRDKLKLNPPLMTKLAPNLMPKHKYSVHYRNLQYYLMHGLKLTHIHRVLAFEQESWIRPYVELNTQLRRAPLSDFEKSLFKLIVNAIFGKTMENVRSYKEVQLVTTMERFLKLAASPRYKGATIFSNELVGVLMTPKTTTLNKPIYDGFTVLETSKLRMFSFHYDFMKPKYGEHVELLFTDTDSFLYNIQTDDIYTDMIDNLDIFDTSGYPQDHPLYSMQNHKVIGKMKDETNSVIKEFVGLKSKMYAFKFADKEVKKAKGIPKQTVKTQMTFDTFKDCRTNEEKCHHRTYRFQSTAHTIHSLDQTKLSLTPYDDKRFILEDGVHTRAYGHKDNVPQVPQANQLGLALDA